MARFQITERSPCWVTWTYIVEATDEDDAWDQFFSSQYAGEGVPDIGEAADNIDSDIEITPLED